MKAILVVLVVVAACMQFCAAGPLDDYVNAPDTYFNVVDLNIRYESNGWVAHVYNMTSQKWLNSSFSTRPIWWHFYVLIVPNDFNRNYTMGLQYIGGSSNHVHDPPKADDKDIAIVADMAVNARCLAAVVFNVPNEPIAFPHDPRHRGNRYEDEIIAFTWWKFITDPKHDPNWILELPMTKAGVKALDAFEIVAKKRLGVTIDTFMVSGASKRGWTTWLVGAVDPKKRVVAIAPIVLDALNFIAFAHRQFTFYGGWSFALKPYYDQNFTQDLDLPETQVLASIVDPYYYRDRLTMPKLVINAGGDEFQMPDDQRYWAHDMKGETNLLMVKNAEHSMITGIPEVLQAGGAFMQALLAGYARPKYAWSICNETGKITFTTNKKPYTVKIAYSNSAKGTGLRDFRWAALNVTPCTLKLFGACLRPLLWDTKDATKVSDLEYTALLPVPKTGWTAFWIEAQWANPTGPDDFRMTSAASVLPNTVPFKDCHGSECRGHLL